MMKSFYTTVFLILTMGLYAQNTWTQTFDTINNTYYYRPINILSHNNELILNYRCHGYYDVEWPEEWDDSGIIKLNSEGNIVWEYTTGDAYTNCMLITENGDIIVATNDYADNYLLKLNNQGDLMWRIPLNDFRVLSLDNTADSNIILSGELNDIPTIQKFTSNGVEIWSQLYNIGPDYEGCLYSISSTDQGEYIASGMINQNVTSLDAFIIKTDANGELIFSKTFDGFGDIDRLYSVAQNSNGNILSVGYCENNDSFYRLFWMLDSNGETILIDNSEEGFNRSVQHNESDNNFIVAGNNLSLVSQYIIAVISSEYELDGFDKSLVILENNLVFFKHSSSYITVCKSDLNGNVNANNDDLIYSTVAGLSNYPNPFNPSTTIEFTIKKTSKVSVSVYNIKGQLVKTLINNKFLSGNHSTIWNGVDENGNQVSTGLYLYKLKVNDKVEAVNKCLLLK